MNKIIVYSSDTCPYCKRAKEELTKNGIVFEEVLINDKTEEWQAVVDLTNMATVPTIRLGGEYFVPGRDFGDVDYLIKRIQNYAPSNYTIEEVIFEKLKTFNYNMSVAFTRTNQILTQIENKLKIEDNEH